MAINVKLSCKGVGAPRKAARRDWNARNLNVRWNCKWLDRLDHPTSIVHGHA